MLPPVPKFSHDDDPDCLKLRKVLDSVHSRRDFLKGIGMGLGYSALAACSSSDDSTSGYGSASSSPDEDPPIDDSTPVTPPLALPAASAEYNALKRTSFGVHRDSLSAMHSLGINAYLENQLDYLSISDGLFVREMLKDPVDHAMVRTIYDVAQVLNLKTIAEWVEDEEVCQALQAIGVDYVQGFYLDKPQLVDELLSETLLDNRLYR